MTSEGQSDIFVSKLDSAGNYVWAKSMGGPIGDAGWSIAVDGSGDVYTTGSFKETVDFDPGPGTLNFTAIVRDSFIQKLDSSGDLVWAHAFGGTGPGVGVGITTDSDGNVYTTGAFSDTVDFDPGPGILNLSAPGGSGMFVQKLDSAGNLVMANTLGGSGDTAGHDIALDSSRAIYLRGPFSGTVDFDPGPSTEYRTSAGFDDMYVLKLTQTPEVNSMIRLGSSPVNASTVVFKVVFSQSVTGVDSTDFAIDATGVTEAAIASVSNITPNAYRVFVDTGTGNGTLSIDLIDDDTIVDTNGTPIGDTGLGNGDFTIGETYTIDRSLPIAMPLGAIGFVMVCVLLCGCITMKRRSISR